MDYCFWHHGGFGSTCYYFCNAIQNHLLHKCSNTINSISSCLRATQPFHLGTELGKNTTIENMQITAIWHPACSSCVHFNNAIQTNHQYQFRDATNLISRVPILSPNKNANSAPLLLQHSCTRRCAIQNHQEYLFITRQQFHSSEIFRCLKSVELPSNRPTSVNTLSIPSMHTCFEW